MLSRRQRLLLCRAGARHLAAPSRCMQVLLLHDLGLRSADFQRLVDSRPEIFQMGIVTMRRKIKFFQDTIGLRCGGAAWGAQRAQLGGTAGTGRRIAGTTGLRRPRRHLLFGCSNGKQAARAMLGGGSASGPHGRTSAGGTACLQSRCPPVSPSSEHASVPAARLQQRRAHKGGGQVPAHPGVQVGAHDPAAPGVSAALRRGAGRPRKGAQPAVWAAPGHWEASLGAFSWPAAAACF